jgi:hypothetical protein
MTHLFFRIQMMKIHTIISLLFSTMPGLLYYHPLKFPVSTSVYPLGKRTHVSHCRVFSNGLGIGILLPIISASLVLAQEPAGVPPLKIVYFLPTDCAAPDYREERLGRVMRHIQDFFRSEMERHGHGPKTFALEWDSPDKLRLYEVRGKRALQEYRNAHGDIYAEVRDALRPQGLNIDEEYILILGPFLVWQNGHESSLGLLVGMGSPKSGCAWATDDLYLDADLLSSHERGCGSTLGIFNTRYIGAIAHELGHCFGLPHEGQLEDQKQIFGMSLMGTGGHNYGEELRNGGPGAFLCEAAALRLSVTRAFNADYKPISGPKQWDFDKLKATLDRGVLVIAGQGTGTPKPIAIIAYNDNLAIPNTYDIKSWVAIPDQDDNFRFRITEGERVPFEMQLSALFADGTTTEMTIRYSGVNNTLVLQPFETAITMRRIRRYFQNNEMSQVQAILEELSKPKTAHKDWKRKLDLVIRQKKRNPLVNPATLPATTKKLDLTTAETRKSQVGWHFPARNLIPEDGFIEVDGKFFDSGLYAHPPSGYVFSLDGRWKRLSFSCGLQDGHSGSVVFVVRGDGKELYRSETIKPRTVTTKTINISGVNELELVTEDAGDGTAHDWGIWITPAIAR